MEQGAIALGCFFSNMEQGGYSIGVRMALRIGYSAASVPLCIGYALLCHQEGGLYICLPSESNGPNLLDEPLKDFIVNPADLPSKWVKRLATLGKRVNHDSQ